MIQVSLKQWSNLSQADRVLAKSLGIAPKEAAPTLKEKVHKPKPYIARAKVYCYLCESRTEQFFHMVLRESEHFLPYLQSVEVTREEAKQLEKEMSYKTQHIEMSTCQVCSEVLMKWSKEELMKKLIEVFPVARSAIVTGGKPVNGRR